MTAAELLELHQQAERNAAAALEAQQARNRAILWAVEHDSMTVREVARLLDLSESRVHAIIKKRES